MLRLWGIPIAAGDARALVATLLADGSPDAVSAAQVIGRGVDRGSGLVALTAEQQTAILSCLEDPPEGPNELRGALIRDHEHRVG
jgi:hypothetical protein